MKMRVALLGSLAAASVSLLATQAPGESTELNLDKPIERDISGGVTHRYQLKMPIDGFAHIRVDQFGSDIEITLTDPTGRKLATRDRPETVTDPEPLSFVTESAGVFIVDARSIDAASVSGKYRIALGILRPATEADRRWVTAEREWQDGHAFFKPDAAQMARAVQHYSEAFRLWNSTDAPEWSAHAGMQLSWSHLYRDEVDPALTVLNQVVALWERLKDDGRGARALNLIAVNMLKRGNALAAVAAVERALPMAKRSGNLRSEGAALGNLSAAHYMLGNRELEFTYSEQSLEIARRMGDEHNLGISLNNIGVSYLGIGEYQKAIEYLREGLVIRQKENDKRGQGGALNAIAEAYRDLGRTREALQFHLQGLALRRAGEDRPGIAQSLGNLGLTYRELGEHQKALEAFEESVQLYREAKNQAGEAAALVNLGVLAYHDLKQADRALAAFKEAIRLAESLNNTPRLASALGHLGRVHLMMGDYESAESELTRALELGRRVKDPIVELGALAHLGRLNVQRGSLDTALTFFEAAVNQLDANRRMLVGDSFRSTLVARNADVQEDYVDALMRLHAARPTDGFDRRALQAVEHTRARGLLEALQQARVDLTSEMTPALAAREQALRSRLTVATRARTSVPATAAPAVVEKAEAELRSVLAEYQELRSAIRRANPRLAALADPQPLSVSEIQTSVVDADTVLLEYAIGPDRSFLWAVTPTQVHSFVLPKQSEIDPLARKATDLLTARNTRRNGESADTWRARVNRSDAELTGVLATLSKYLIEPATRVIAGKRLVIVANGSLHFVPFGALPAPGTSEPLVTAHELVALPSASTLAILRAERSGRPRPPRAVAVLADPVFDSGDGRLPTSQRRSQPAVQTPAASSNLEWAISDARAAEDGRLPRLRYSRDEANVIQSLTRAGERFVALDFNASLETAVSERLRDYRIVHFASHGFVNGEHPELSGLALSMVNERGEPIDGFLRLHQIYNLKLPADLVVLSACQTALGSETRGEGPMSLTRGFMYAGASTVAATLWRVDDQATAELMKLFYREMLGPAPKPPAAALRAAQVSLMKQPRWRSPYYWAAFTLQGDWK